MGKPGTVWLVGAGPGALGLMTLRGEEVLARADVVYYDRLVNPAILLAARAQASLIDTGKTPRGKRVSQTEIHRRLIQSARKGLRVVRLKGGDPFVFGRGGEEAAALVQAKIPFEVVPGVTAGIAAPAYAGIPVTQRGVSTEVTFQIGEQASGSVAGKTLVGYMAMAGLAKFLQRAKEMGFAETTAAALIERGTTSRQRVMRAKLGTLAARAKVRKAKAPAVVVVGKVVELEKSLAWWQKRPLAGQRVILTVSKSLGRGWKETLQDQGAEVWEIPMTTIEPLPIEKSWKDQIKRSDWLVFTSAAAVRLFPAIGPDLRGLGQSKIAAVGQSTAQVLRSIGLVPDWVGAGPGSRAMLRDWPLSARGKVLHLTGSAGRGELVQGLRKKGYEAERLVVYRNGGGDKVPLPVRSALRTEGADWVIFGSGTAAERFREIVPHWEVEPRVVAIGPATAKVARRVGWKVSSLALEPSGAGVLRAILKAK